jgi:hypothetical protein
LKFTHRELPFVRLTVITFDQVNRPSVAFQQNTQFISTYNFVFPSIPLFLQFISISPLTTHRLHTHSIKINTERRIQDAEPVGVVVTKLPNIVIHAYHFLLITSYIYKTLYRKENKGEYPEICRIRVACVVGTGSFTVDTRSKLAFQGTRYVSRAISLCFPCGKVLYIAYSIRRLLSHLSIIFS